MCIRDRLYTVVDPRLPYRVSGDLTRVRQVLANLVSNAVKYTDSGEVALLARLPEDELGEHTVELVVRDTGVGITASEQEKIFDKYGQTSKSRGGTGLGLHIVQSIVELMGGTVHLSSRPGEGSTFTVSLSLAAFQGDDHVIRGKLEQTQQLRIGLIGPTKESLRSLNAPLVSCLLYTSDAADE